MQAPLRTTVSIFESLKIRTPKLLGFIYEVEHPSEAVVVSEFLVCFLLWMPLGFTSLVVRLKENALYSF